MRHRHAPAAEEERAVQLPDAIAEPAHVHFSSINRRLFSPRTIELRGRRVLMRASPAVSHLPEWEPQGAVLLFIYRRATMIQNEEPGGLFRPALANREKGGQTPASGLLL